MENYKKKVLKKRKSLHPNIYGVADNTKFGKLGYFEQINEYEVKR